VKTLYPSCVVTLGGAIYTVHLQLFAGRAAPHVGADSPRYLDPGRRPRARVIRILREQIDVTDELTYWNRKTIEEKVFEMVKARVCVGSGDLSFNVEKRR
jgi:hypothetical protein